MKEWMENGIYGALAGGGAKPKRWEAERLLGLDEGIARLQEEAEKPQAMWKAVEISKQAGPLIEEKEQRWDTTWQGSL